MLHVRYAVIVITAKEDAGHSEYKLIQIMKAVSKQNIRLAVVFYDQNDKIHRKRQAVLLVQKMQSIFFVLGNSSTCLFSEVL